GRPRLPVADAGPAAYPDVGERLVLTFRGVPMTPTPDSGPGPARPDDANDPNKTRYEGTRATVGDPTGSPFPSAPPPPALPHTSPPPPHRRPAPPPAPAAPPPSRHPLPLRLVQPPGVPRPRRHGRRLPRRGAGPRRPRPRPSRPRPHRRPEARPPRAAGLARGRRALPARDPGRQEARPPRRRPRLRVRGRRRRALLHHALRPRRQPRAAC